MHTYIQIGPPQYTHEEGFCCNLDCLADTGNDFVTTDAVSVLLCVM